MNDQLTELLIEAVRDCTRAVTTLTAKLDSIQASGPAGVPTQVGTKPGAFELTGVEVIALAKDYPTEYGWFKAKVGHGREGLWVETKSKSAGALLQSAKDLGWFLDITYDKKIKGEFTNHYLETAVKVDGSRPPAEEEEEAPPPKKKAETPW